MARRLKATLRGVWWTEQLRAIRYCFACGGKLRTRYVVEEKRRRLSCAVCDQITYVNPKVVAGMIPVMPDGRVILLRRSIEPAIGRWTYPAGYQEMGESVAQAAVRETREEAAIKADITETVGVYSYPDAGVVTVVFLGRVRKGEKPRAGEEAQSIGLFWAKDIPWKDLAFRSTADALRHWIEGRRTPGCLPQRSLSRLSPKL